MISAVIFVCNIVAMKIRNTAHQRSEYISGMGCCFESPESFCEASSAHQMFLDSESSQTSLGTRKSKTHIPMKFDSMHLDSTDVATIGDWANIAGVQQAQHFDVSRRGSSNRTAGNEIEKSNFGHIYSDGCRVTQKKQICVLEIVANLEMRSYGFLLGR